MNIDYKALAYNLNTSRIVIKRAADPDTAYQVIVRNIARMLTPEQAEIFLAECNREAAQ